MAFVKQLERAAGRLAPLRGRPPALLQPAPSLLIENRWGRPVVAAPYWVCKGGRPQLAVPVVLRGLELVEPLARLVLLSLPEEEFGVLIYPLEEVEGAVGALLSVELGEGERFERLTVWGLPAGGERALANAVADTVGLSEAGAVIRIHDGPFYADRWEGGRAVAGFVLRPGETAVVAPPTYRLFASRDGRLWFKPPGSGEGENPTLKLEVGTAFPNPRFYIVYNVETEVQEEWIELPVFRAVDWRLPGGRIPPQLEEAILEYESEQILSTFPELIEGALEGLKEQVERGEKPLDGWGERRVGV